MRNKILITILTTVFAVICHAQVMDNSHKVDTLSILERLSIRTNIPDWVLGVPNIGAEFDIRNVNWNRWSAGVNIRWRPKGSANIIKPIVYDLFEVTLEGREYWRERRATVHGYLSPHVRWLDKLFSCRNKFPSHPYWIFYRGGYVGMSQFSNMFGDKGYQGRAYMAGVTWGFVKPFLAWNNGSSLDLEFGISAGAIMASYDTYTHDEYNNCYPKTGHVDRKIMPVIKDIHVGLVYRMGHYPIQKKYRWRYDVDLAFQAKKDSLYNRWLLAKEQKFINDSIYKVVAGDFRLLYDSCVVQRHIEDQEAIDLKSPVRVVNTLKRQVEDSIFAAKIAKDKAKVAKKQEAAALKAAADKVKAEKQRLKKNAREIKKAESKIKKVDDKYGVKNLKTNIAVIKYQKADAKERAAEKQREEKRQKKQTRAAQKEKDKLTKSRNNSRQREAKAEVKERAKAASSLKKEQQRETKAAQKDVQREKREQEKEARRVAKINAQRAAIKAKIEALKNSSKK